MREVQKCILIVAALMSASSCTKFNNDYDSLLLNCELQTSAVEQRKGASVLQVVSPSGSSLSPEDVKDLSIHYNQDSRTDSLRPSARGCFVVEGDGVLTASIASKGWSIVKVFQGLSPGLQPRTLFLGKAEEPNLSLDCPAQGFSVSDALRPRFSLPGVSKPEDFDIRIEVVDPESKKTEKVLFEKRRGESLAFPGAVDLSDLPEGAHALQGVARNGAGRAFTVDPRVCPMTLDRTPPTLHDSAGAPEDKVIAQGEGAAYPLAASDAGGGLAGLFVCSEKLSAWWTSVPLKPSGKACIRDEDFALSSNIAFFEEGYWLVSAFSRDTAGNRSPVWKRVFHVDGGKPSISVEWANPDLNRLPNVSVGRKKKHTALVRLDDRTTAPEELGSRLECRVELKTHERNEIRSGGYARCTNGACQGKALKDFLPCGVKSARGDGTWEVDLELASRWDELDGNLFLLTVRTSDALSHVAQAQAAFWMQDEQIEGISETPALANGPLEWFFQKERLFFLRSSGVEVLYGNLIPFPIPEGYSSIEDFVQQVSVAGHCESMKVISLSPEKHAITMCAYFTVFSQGSFSPWMRIPCEREKCHQEMFELRIDDEGMLWGWLFDYDVSPEGQVRLVGPIGTGAQTRVLSELFGERFRSPSFLESPGGAIWVVWVASDWSAHIAQWKGGKWHLIPPPPFPVSRENEPVVDSNERVWAFDPNKGWKFLHDGQWVLPLHDDCGGECLGLFGSVLPSRGNVIFGTNGSMLSSFDEVFAFSGGRWKCVSCDLLIDEPRPLPMGDPLRAFTSAWVDENGFLLADSGNAILRCDQNECIWGKPRYKVDSLDTADLSEVSFGRQRLDARMGINTNEPHTGTYKEKIDAVDDAGRAWAIVRLSVDFFGERGPAVFVREKDRLIPFSTPPGRNCTYQGSEGLSISGEGTVFARWCGGVFRLSLLGWEQVLFPAALSIESEIDSSNEGNYVTSFFPESDFLWWVAGGRWVPRENGDGSEYRFFEALVEGGKVTPLEGMPENGCGGRFVRGHGGRVWCGGKGFFHNGRFHAVSVPDPESFRIDEYPFQIGFENYWNDAEGEIFGVETYRGQVYRLDQENFLWVLIGE